MLYQESEFLGSNGQKDLIEKKDWDCLIILDACRYDFFESNYGRYLNGRLRKVISEGYNTSQWLKGTFSGGDYGDCIYISTHPGVNSKGIEVIGGFDGSELFSEVIDLWDSGWEEETGTVPPDSVARATLEVRNENQGKRVISHFMQPHIPYLNLDRSVKIKTKKPLVTRLRSWVAKIFARIFGRSVMYKISDKMGISQHTEKGEKFRRGAGYMNRIAEKWGDEKLRDLYEGNLRIVLEEVQKLLENLDGNIIVTADHGDLLGENGIYGHGFEEDKLKEVPWLEINNVE